MTIPGKTLGELYAGKTVLFIGATGFLGGVTLSMLLQHLPTLARVHVVVRKTPGVTAERRFAERVLPGVAFEPLRARFGTELDALVAVKVLVHAGDITLPGLGLDEAVLASLEHQVDLIMNCSGLVDFHAPLDRAYLTNIVGTRHLIGLCQRTGARLVHTSTCYVAGSADGHVGEKIVLGAFPRHADAPFLTFDADIESTDIEAELALVRGQFATAQTRARLTELAVTNFRALNHADPTEAALANAVKRLSRDEQSAAMIAAGRTRAGFWGWPNVYTYSKAIAEQILAASGVHFAVVRPAIIESALSYPVRGWNQNATTSAPLVMLALGGFGRVPAEAAHVLDLIPVDQVAWSILAAGAATLAGEQVPVYQIGTSDANPCTMGRITDLIGIYVHERALADNKGIKGLWQANAEPRLVDALAFRRDTALFAGVIAWLSAHVTTLHDAVTHQQARGWLATLRDRASDASADVAKAVGLWDIFMPFSHDHDYRFATQHMRDLAAKIGRDSVLSSFSPESIDWREYWLDVHIPGLRRWVFSPDGEGTPDLPGTKALKPLPATLSLLDKVEGVARLDGHRQALAYMVGDRPLALTYAELWQAAGALAAALPPATSSDPPIGVLADPFAPWPVAWLGVLRAGHAALLVRPRTPEAAWAIETPMVLAYESPGRCLVHHQGGEVTVLDRVDFVPNDWPPSSARGSFLVECDSGWRVEGPLEPRTFAGRLVGLTEWLGLDDRDCLLMPLPSQDGRETDALALIVLATLYAQAGLDLVAAGDWPDALDGLAPTALVFTTEGWAAAPKRPRGENWQRVTRVLDLAPLAPGSSPGTYQATGIAVHQALWDPAATAVVAGRILKAKPETARGEGPGSSVEEPFVSIAPYRIHVEEGSQRLLAMPPGAEAWQDTGWLVKSISGGVMGGVAKRGDPLGFRLEGDGAIGTRGRLASALQRAGNLRWVEVLPAGVDEHGLKVLAEPDLDAIESYPSWRRQMLDAVWSHNAGAALADRITAVGLQLAVGGLAEATPTAIWIDTRRKPRTEDEPDLSELRDETLAFFAPAFPAVDFGFFVDHLDAGPLGYERLASFERVLMRGARRGGLLAQAFLQAFEVEFAKTTRPSYRAARAVGTLLGRVQRWSADEDPVAPLLPEPLNEAVRQGVAAAAMAFYRHGLDVTVHGAPYIPAGENFLVVANHASHLDGGLVKFALGAWGRRLHAVAAKDYFFGTPARRFISHHFTRLIPTDRHKVSSEWLRRAREVLLDGDCVLIFPEGTRGEDGAIQPFKASLGTLAKAVRMPIVPVRITGTAAILPKGAVLPRGRRVTIHVGPPIPFAILEKRVADLPPIQQDRAIAALLQEAVEGLPEHHYWWLQPDPVPTLSLASGAGEVAP